MGPDSHITQRGESGKNFVMPQKSLAQHFGKMCELGNLVKLTLVKTSLPSEEFNRCADLDRIRHGDLSEESY